MIGKRSLANEFEEEIRKVRHQTLTTKNHKLKTLKESTNKREKAKRKREKARDILVIKLDNYEEEIPNFTTDDIIHYFAYLYEETNKRPYYISWARDRTHVVRLREAFDNLSICLMIEFLFNSDQTYLNKRDVAIGVLSSGWSNTVLADSELWVNDEYDDSKRFNRNKKKTVKRENDWVTNESSSPTTKIGEW